MENFLLQALPPQSIKIYRQLDKGAVMSAKDLGRQLDIFPNAVYRAVGHLLDCGLVSLLPGRPIKYQARAKEDSLQSFESIIRQNFFAAFDSGGPGKAPSRNLELSFTRTRQELLLKTNHDIKSSKELVNIVASGLEVPKEHILVLKKAIDNGVGVKVLVQRQDEISRAMFDNWKKLGIAVKLSPDIGARIIVIDHRIVYFTSYNPQNKQEAIGVRFEYPPFAFLMDQLFDQRWGSSQVLPGVSR